MAGFLTGIGDVEHHQPAMTFSDFAEPSTHYYPEHRSGADTIGAVIAG
jgi:hypothetical protein